MTTPDSTQSPAGMALLRLLAANDALAADHQAVALIDRPGVLVVIVDTPRAWGMWVYAVRSAASGPSEFHRGQHMTTAENVVDGWPVQVIRTAAYPAERARLVVAA